MPFFSLISRFFDFDNILRENERSGFAKILDRLDDFAGLSIVWVEFLCFGA